MACNLPADNHPVLVGWRLFNGLPFSGKNMYPNRGCRSDSGVRDTAFLQHDL